MTRRIVFALVVLALLAPAAAFAVGSWETLSGSVSGSGFVRSETRTAADFHALELEGIGNVTITQGLVPRITVTTDDNILPLVKTEVVNGVLRLGFRTGTSIRRLTRLEFQVVVPGLDAIVLSGSGNVRTGAALQARALSLSIRGSGRIEVDVTADELVADIGGSGDIRVAGSARTLRVDVGGSGSVRARDLAVQDAQVRIDGSGSADVTVAGTLDAAIDGSGSVLYGGGARVNVRDSGSGSVRAR